MKPSSSSTPYSVVVACLLLCGCQADKTPVPVQVNTDAEQLCAAYGGVREVTSKTYTIRNSAKETGLSAYCNDGSYVARHTEEKP